MIQKIELDNGVRILAESIPHVRSVSMGVWIGTGSRNEHKEENGISHFLEHMFFKGTKTRSAAQIAETFDRIGGQVNAFTSKEYTCYYAKVLDDHSKIAIDVLSDMFFNSLFEKTELAKERNVVLEEIKMVDDTPDDIVHDLLSEASYGKHSLSYPILGTVETLETFTEEHLRDYMDRFYTGDYVVVSIAGNITDEIIEQIKEVFSAVKPTTYELKREAPVFIPEKIIRKKETEQAHLCLGYPGLEIGHKDVYGLVLLNNLLGGSMSSRLFQEIREQRGLCYSVFSYHSSYQDSGMLTVYAGTAHKQLDELIEAVHMTTANLAEKGMTEKELANGKEQLKGNLMLSLESTNSRMSRNGKNELLLKQHRSLDEIIQEINDVQLDEVNKIAKLILTNNPSISLINATGEMPEALQG
ncbi:zinc protease [Alkalihalobacillus alcalophilus ATCC 27647 = CGMCC 1.3604]|uniref:Zinc protease n=1 Tax=Alkalihalobacillus alcalophilus ATCC 27647 = CGMCC 1.3604 TaxID=1218173 RepID=A0A094YXF1_ALKAL|nr:pitrilysin family protein [Alkalihalobacillus alcalophilus]KGA98202.1 zinc protease [Alkalihalobacillus alcalophilus ATCC 27647 = CGMCC 1.3604]MED1562141.1 pitrilysin family protein [Alkalihalobacillus alcalophilus]THG91366.1 zinc protease [Alkalihalobacillus alcalophilus ATCC 27647 = CGMCC 1.3604]